MFELNVVGGDARPALRWLGAGSLVTQAIVLSGLAVFPLLYPAQMPPYQSRPQPISLDKPKIPQPKPERVPVVHSSATSQPALPAMEMHASTIATISRSSPATAMAGPLMLPFGFMMSKEEGLFSRFGSGIGTGRDPLVVANGESNSEGKRSSVRLSQGVTNGMLLGPIRPEYPPIAKATRTEGVVILTATIDRTGRIVGLRVLSGPPMLRQAAENAVREARYKPYLLNGAPTEVETTISVNFRMSS